MNQSLRRPDAGTLRALPSLAAILAIPALALAIGAVPARAACIPDPPSDDGTVSCSGTDETGFDASGANNVTISTVDAAELDDSDPGLDSAILIGDESTVTIGADATVTVNGIGGHGIRGDDDNDVEISEGATVLVNGNGAFGIRGDDDNFVENQGTIVVEGDDARAISIDENTTGVLPNGAVNGGTIRINGDRGIALETGANSGVANSGTIELNGAEGIGLSAGNRTDRTKAANITHGTGATLLVTGADGFGLKVGDGWVDGTVRDHDSNPATPDRLVPSAAGVRIQGLINVIGNGSTGVFVGDESNLAGNHNSLTTVSGTVAVSGANAVGLSLGGNDLFDRFDLTSTAAIGSSLSLDLSGSITGDADSGALVVFRDFVAERENRMRVTAAGEILANVNAVAIRGSDGDELIANVGEIRGRIELQDGDDRYLHFAGATRTGVLSGGDGDDEVLLSGARADADTFDVSGLQSIETLRLLQGTAQNRATPWILTGTSGFTGRTVIDDFATLEIPDPITLGGALEVADEGTIRVTLDGTTPPLTIQGAATLDGTLEVVQGENLTPSATPYRVVLANGGYTGRFDEIEFPDASGTRIFTASYDNLGLLALFEDVGLLGVARSSNQRAIAQNLLDLQAAGGSTGDLQDLLDGIEDVENIGSVYEALSPEAYDAQTTVSVEAGRRVAALLFDRPRECTPGEVDPWAANARVLPCHARRVSPWAATIGSFRSRDGFDGHVRYDAQIGGLIAGVDLQPVAGLDFTLAVSSQRGSIDVARAGESTLTLAELTGAASWSPGPLRIQGVVSWGHGFHQDRRRIQVDDPAAPIDTRGIDDHESDRTLLATEIGYRVAAGPIGIEPIVGFDWAFVEQDGIREDEAGGFGLEIDERDDEVGSVRGGLRLSSVYEHKAYLGPWLEWATGIWRPSFDVAWRQFVEGNERDVSARLQGSPDTAGNFTIQGEEDEGGAEIGVGFRFVPVQANRLRIDLRYQAYVAEHTLEQDLVGQIAIAF